MIKLLWEFFNISKKEFLQNKFYLIFGAILIVLAFFLRVWRIDQLLWFFYDQGRDALVISEILQGNFTLIGPTTGIEGIFLGPFYYYFLSIGYLIGGGNPWIASIYHSFMGVLGFIVVFYIAKNYFDIKVALTFLILVTFSYNEIISNRWMANPTPAVLFSPLVLLFVSLSFKNPTFLIIATFCAGLLLQLEASSSIFLILITAFFILIYRRKYNLKILIFSFSSFVFTLLPQFIFEFRNNFLITKNILSFIASNTPNDNISTFQIPNFITLSERLNLYSNAFFEKIAVNFNLSYSFIFLIFTLLVIFVVKLNWEKPIIKICTFWFFGILICFLFYFGNYGRIYKYYLNPIFPIFFLYLALILKTLAKIFLFKILVILFLLLFLFEQLKFTSSYLISGIDGEKTIALGNENLAVEYVLSDSKNQDFNVDVYVPPVIPYAYDYLFYYYIGKRLDQINSKTEKNLYTIHEYDGEILEREKKWLKRQDGIGKITKQVRFGGIGVEKRERIK